MADVTCPGNPHSGLVPQRARMVGLYGRCRPHFAQHYTAQYAVVTYKLTPKLPADTFDGEKSNFLFFKIDHYHLR